MKTQQSRRYFDLMMGALNKAAQDFKEELHPRDESGRFASKPGGGAAVATQRGAQSLAAEASALRAMGDLSEARKLEERLRAMRGAPSPRPAPKPKARRPRRAPRRAPRPAPAAPRHAAPAGYELDSGRSKLPEARQAQLDHEQMRIRNARTKARRGGAPFNDLMMRRMNAIGRPEKLKWFRDALVQEGKDALAMHAERKLLNMGYDRLGNPVKKVTSPKRAPAPAPAPARPAAPAAPQVVPDPDRSPLRDPRPAEKSHEKMRIRNAKAKYRGPDYEKAMRRRMNAIKNPQKMYNFADALADVGDLGLSMEATKRLKEMGYDEQGNPIKRGDGAPAAAPAPVRREPKPAREKPAKAGKGVERGKAGVKNPMKAVNTNIDMLQAATKDFKANVKSVKQMGMGQQGIGRTFKVKLADGSKAIYKPTNGTGLQRYYDRGHPVRRTITHKIPEGSREMVAFAISNSAGFDVVPHIEKVDFKDVEGSYKGKGHAMAWVNGEEVCNIGHQTFSNDVRADHPDLHRIAALDFMTCNTDRHARNYMKGDDGRYYAIDNGLAVCEDQKTSEYRSSPHGHLEGHRIPREVRDEIQAIDTDKIAKRMKEEGFPQTDIDGTISRITYLKGKTTWESPRNDMFRVKAGRR